MRIKKCVIKACDMETEAHQLCRTHYKRAQRLKMKNGGDINKAVYQIVETENAKANRPKDEVEITALNADDQKAIFDASYKREQFLKLLNQRDKEQGRLGLKSEMASSVLEVVHPIWERIVSMIDDLPEAIAHKNKGQCREILSHETSILKKSILKFFDSLEEMEEEEEERQKEFWKSREEANV